MNTPTRKIARTAGLLYLIVVLTGIFSLAYVPAQTIVSGDIAKTAAGIMASEMLFRMGIVAGFVCYTAFLVLPLVLYRLLSPIDKNAAVLMVVLAVASVPLSFVNMLHKLDVLSLLNGAGYSTAFTTDQLHAQVRLALDQYRNGLLVNKIFWGLWLLPFGYLVFRSGMLPRFLGVLLTLGCLGYLVDFFGQALFSGYKDTALASYVRLPATVGEIGTCLWLLIIGAREPVRSTG